MKGKCILIIEDHAESCDAVKKMIERRGGSAECAHTVKEGVVLERIKRECGKPYDCIVSDLGFPQSSTADTIEVLRGFLSNGIPVRALSGSSEPETVAACLDAGIKLILKGTAAEGIMESILYAIAENSNSNIAEVAEEIIDNRAVTREIPKHSQVWFFVNWPKWGQVVGAAVSILTIGGTIVTVSTAMIKSVNARAVSDEAARRVLLESAAIAEKVKKDERDIRELQDDRIKIFEKLTFLTESSRRIEDKLEKK